MLRRFCSAVHAHPKTAAGLLILLILILGGSGYGYALYRWDLAQTSLQDGRLAQAKSSVDLCLWLWPRSVPVRLAAARIYRLHGELADAEEHLNRCLQIQRGASEAVQLEFMLLRVQLGEVDEVEKGLWDCVNSQHAESKIILETLARAHMHNLRYRHALICLDRLIELAPDLAQPHDWRGWVLERMNNPPEALKEYKKALDLNPELVSVRLKVVEILLDKSQAPEALPHLERLHRQFPQRPDVLARLGQCRLLQGKHDEARPLLEAALEKMPDDALLLIHLARLELQDGPRPARAEELLRRVLKSDPADVEAQYALITALQLQGRADEAAVVAERYQKTRALLERANKLLKDDAENVTNDPAAAADLGANLLAIGQERLGAYWLQQALVRDPAHMPAHRALAEYYESKGDTARAAPHRRRLPK